MSADGSTVDLATYDPIQAALMDEVCILVDREDRVTGKATKKVCTSLITVSSRNHTAFTFSLALS